VYSTPWVHFHWCAGGPDRNHLTAFLPHCLLIEALWGPESCVEDGLIAATESLSCELCWNVLIHSTFEIGGVLSILYTVSPPYLWS